MPKTTISVDTDLRDRLAALAAEQGTTVQSLLAGLVPGRLTDAECAARVVRGRAGMRRHMPNPPSDETLDAAPADMIDRVHRIAAKIRGGQPTEVGMILLDTRAICAFWYNHETLAHLIERANHSHQAELHVSAVCLMEAETLLPGSGYTILEQPGIEIVPLDHLAVAAAELTRERPEIPLGVAQTITCTAPEPAWHPGAVVVSTETELYPDAVVVIHPDHLALR